VLLELELGSLMRKNAAVRGTYTNGTAEITTDLSYTERSEPWDTLTILDWNP
jgi:hypothetical protein